MKEFVKCEKCDETTNFSILEYNLVNIHDERFFEFLKRCNKCSCEFKAYSNPYFTERFVLSKEEEENVNKILEL